MEDDGWGSLRCTEATSRARDHCYSSQHFCNLCLIVVVLCRSPLSQPPGFAVMSIARNLEDLDGCLLFNESGSRWLYNRRASREQAFAQVLRKKNPR